MGFIRDIESILSFSPKEKQMLLFGATISREIDHIERKYMDHPVIAEAESHVTEEFLEQYYLNVRQEEKFSLLVHLLNTEKTERVIVFCSARYNVERVFNNLRKQGIRAGMIHGKMPQNKRMRVIDEFNRGKRDILIASPVAARGLDIKEVSHILNYDLSQDPQEYVHRVGRTARAGESGKAITLLSTKDHDVFRLVIDNYGMNVQELEEEKFPILRFESGRNTRHNDRRSRHGRHQRNSRRKRSNSESRSWGDRSRRPSRRARSIATPV